MALQPRAERLLAGAAQRLLGDRRLLIATNRGPVSFAVAPDGALRPRRGSGGLVTALSQVGRHVPLTWVAAPMSEGDRQGMNDAALIDRAVPGDMRLRFVPLERGPYDAAFTVTALAVSVIGVVALGVFPEPILKVLRDSVGTLF